MPACFRRYQWIALCAIFSAARSSSWRGTALMPRRGGRSPWLVGQPVPGFEGRAIRGHGGVRAVWFSARAALEQSREQPPINAVAGWFTPQLGDAHSLHDGCGRVEHPRAGRHPQGLSDAQHWKHPSLHAFDERDELRRRDLVPLALAPTRLNHDEASRASRARLRSTPQR